MKEFHILTVGNSLITNYQRKSGDQRVEGLAMGDRKWEELLDDPGFLEDIYEFLKGNCMEHSAEFNSFFKYCEERKVDTKDCEVYCTGTRTASNEIALRTIQRHIRNLGIVIFERQIPGYFESEPSHAKNDFEKGLIDMLDTFIYLARKKKDAGYRVVFNPTGGFKAHVITSAFAGFITGSEVYYIHEEFKNVIVFPPFFYFPRGREIEVLNRLRDKKPLSGGDYRNIIAEYTNEVERLDMYNLVEIEYDSLTKTGYRIRITRKGEWALDYLEGLEKG